MPIALYQSTIQLNYDNLRRDLNSTSGRTRLRSQLRQQLRSSLTPTVVTIPSDLQDYVDRYAEQVTLLAMADLDKFFVFQQQRGFTVGGLPTGFPPLAIMPRDIKPSNTAISAIGEGVAGWYIENHLRFRPLSRTIRPVGEGPDFILVNQTTPASVVLVEVKGTPESSVIAERLVEAAVPRGLQYTCNVADRRLPGRYAYLLLGVLIRQISDLELWSLRIDLQ
jgi:hypothetical protein